MPGSRLNFLPVLCLFVLSGTVLASPWAAYENSRFGYSLTIPQGLTVTGRADDGSGVTWQTGTFKVQVYGSNNRYKIAPERWFANVRVAAGDRIVDERTSKPDQEPRWHEILYLKEGRRVHRKTFVGEGSVNTVEVSYGYAHREQKQPLGQKLVDSFRPGDLAITH